MRDLDQYEKYYEKQPYEKYQVKFRKKKVLELIAGVPHCSILEIGCGLEPLFLDFDDFESLTVLEPANLFFQTATQQLLLHPLSSGRVSLVQTTLEDYRPPADQAAFDLILVSSLLHEIREPLAFLHQVRRLCSQNTRVHVNVPNGNSFHRLLAVEMNLISSSVEISESNTIFQQTSVFTNTTLRRLVENADFQVIEAGSYAPKFFTHFQMQQLLQTGLITEKMLDGI